ncbi:MAG: PQQ-dependent sugar dehydrogenase, partial [Frankiaceae bacterium]|nr:PQQ-dependent sugar dehydrogenase [Arenimonas sp.]
MHPLLSATVSSLVLVIGACSAQDGVAAADTSVAPNPVPAPFAITEVAKFNEPWAMAFLPDGRLLVTEKAGQLRLLEPGGHVGTVTGVPSVSYGGQG